MTDEQPAGKKRRGMLGFYVGLGVVALLVIGGWLSWKPLRREYAIYRLTRWSRGEDDSGVIMHWWGEECLKAACKGDRRAVELAVSRTPLVDPHAVLQAQPELFIDVLDRRDDATAREVLGCIALNITFSPGPSGGSVMVDSSPTLTKDISKIRRIQKPGCAMLADYAERRFAEELAAEKKNAGE